MDVSKTWSHRKNLFVANFTHEIYGLFEGWMLWAKGNPYRQVRVPPLLSEYLEEPIPFSKGRRHWATRLAEEEEIDLDFLQM